VWCMSGCCIYCVIRVAAEKVFLAADPGERECGRFMFKHGLGRLCIYITRTGQ
jgi:hypothetical protein